MTSTVSRQFIVRVRRLGSQSTQARMQSFFPVTGFLADGIFCGAIGHELAQDDLTLLPVGQQLIPGHELIIV